jgi:hypothetical protein
MNMIRKYLYAAVLVLSALNFAPSFASAQDEGGNFTLPHEVYWQGAIVPAGEYSFTLQSMGPSEMLMLRKISGASASFMLMANDTDVIGDADTARLIIAAKDGVRYISRLSLPQFEVTLHFAVPRVTGKEIAELKAAAVTGAAR